jgi:PAS domain S-box-containing protein
MGATTTLSAGSPPSELPSIFREMNQALLLGSIRQHELTGESERLNAQLKIEISQREQTEMALRSLAAIIECSDDAIVGMDLDGIVTSWNKGAEKVFGYSSSEMVGISMVKLLPDNLRDGENQILAKIRNGERVEHFETRRQAKDGRMIDISITASPIRDAGGRIIGVSKVARNIDERKAAEEVLRTSERRFRALVTAGSDVVYRMSPDWSIMSQLDGQKFIVDTKTPSGAWLQEYIYPEDQPRVLAAINEAIQTKSPFVLEHRVRRVDGSLGWTFSRAIPMFDAEGEIIEWFGAASDVTERKNSVEQIRQLNSNLEKRVADRTRQLQVVNDELEAFSYSVSHDLRAPLRHVLGFVAMLQKDAGPSLSENNLRLLTTVSESAKQMGTLIDDLLAFSRLGRAELQKVEFNPDQLVHEVVNGFLAEIKQRSITWEIQPLPAVCADRALLRMVLVNLISNAIKFTGARTKARIEIGSVPGDATEVVIFIRDNGAGFDPEYAGRLFGVFQRLHSAEEFEGTGIGLANVQRIIQRHGGRTWAEAVVDRGATFYFSLPRQSSATE